MSRREVCVLTSISITFVSCKKVGTAFFAELNFTFGRSTYSDFTIFLEKSSQIEYRSLFTRAKPGHTSFLQRWSSELDFCDAINTTSFHYLLGTHYRAGHHKVHGSC